MRATSGHRPRRLGIFVVAAVCLAAGAARADEDVESGADEAPAAAASGEDAEPASDAAPAVAAEGAAPLPDLGVLAASPVHGVESSGYGWRDDPIRHRARFHCGADFRAERGTPVHAAAAGVVISAGRRGGYGRMIAIRHGAGLVTRYAHLEYIGVRVGQEVAADAVIGRVGSSGRATGPHLHFEVRIAGRAVDPGVAVRVGDAMRGGSPADFALGLLALTPEAQARSVSALDPPRRAHGRTDKARAHRHPGRRRPPRIS